MSDTYCIVQTKDVLPDAALPSSWHWHSFEFEVCPYTSLDQLGCLGINVEPIAT